MAHAPEETVSTESIGSFLKRQRESKAMSLAEIARTTRIPVGSLYSLELDQFDDLPGEVFVRGFLKAYAVAVGLIPDEVLARYTASRRLAYVTALPLQTQHGMAPEGSRRFGVAVAFVLLLILFTLALSIVLKPRGREMPAELSWLGGAACSPQTPHAKCEGELWGI